MLVGNFDCLLKLFGTAFWSVEAIECIESDGALLKAKRSSVSKAKAMERWSDRVYRKRWSDRVYRKRWSDGWSFIKSDRAKRLLLERLGDGAIGAVFKASGAIYGANCCWPSTLRRYLCPCDDSKMSPQVQGPWSTWQRQG